MSNKEESEGEQSRDWLTGDGNDDDRAEEWLRQLAEKYRTLLIRSTRASS